MTDLVLPDSGAEGVSNFIRTRGEAGSYASVVDSDSTVKVGHYHWTMFHIRGFNSRSLGLSFACKAAQWPTLPPEWVDGALRQGAAEAATMCEWVRERFGWSIPTRELSRQAALDGARGFVRHGTMDPGRRYDPGDGFPLDRFGQLYIEECLARGFDPNEGGDTGGGVMGKTSDQRITDATILIQRVVKAWGADIGSTGPAGDGVDGDPGPRTLEAAVATFDAMDGALDEAGSRERILNEQILELREQLKKPVLGTEGERLAEVGRQFERMVRDAR